MIQSSTNQENSSEVDTNEEKKWIPGLLRRLTDSLFGYDFFISYTWSDGRTYAKALAHCLEADGFECFLDSDDYCKGDDWKRVGYWTLRRTSRLVLVGSPNVHRSKPVLRELQIFSRFERQIIPISFDGTLDPEKSQSPLFEFFNSNNLRIDESIQHLQSGPSDTAVNDLRNTFKLMRQSHKRVRFFAIATFVFAAIAALAVVFWRVSEKRATELTIGEAYRLMELGSAQLSTGDPNQAGKTFAQSQRTFHEIGRNPLIALHRRLAADIAAIPAEKILKTNNGQYVSDIHVSLDGKLIALLFDYESRNNANDSTEEQLRNEPAVEVWQVSTGKRLAHYAPLSDIGKMIYPAFHSLDSEDLDELNGYEGPVGEVVGIEHPCDLILMLGSQADDHNESNAMPTFKRISLLKGTRTNLHANEVQQYTPQRPRMHVGFEERTLRLDPRDTNGAVYYSGFFDFSPEDGIDHIYGDYIPELVNDESWDKTRAIVGTYEGNIALFDTSTGNQLRSGKLKVGVRDISFLGRSHTSVLVDQDGTIWKLPETIPALRRDIMPDSRLQQLELSATGEILAGYGTGEMFAYDVVNAKALGHWTVGGKFDEAIAFQLDEETNQLHIVMQNGQLISADYSKPNQSTAKVNLFESVGVTKKQVKSFAASIELLHQHVYFAYQLEGQKDVIVESEVISSTGSRIPRRVIPLPADSHIRQIHAIARRGSNLLLVVGDGEFTSEDLIQIPVNPRNNKLTTTTLFEPVIRQAGPDTVSICEEVSALYSSSDDHWFARTGRTVPLFSLSDSETFRLSSALRIRDVKEAEMISVAVTYESKEEQLYLVIENPDRELLYKTPLPVTSRPTTCAISNDGMRIGLATYDNGLVLVDLNVYLSE